MSCIHVCNDTHGFNAVIFISTENFVDQYDRVLGRVLDLMHCTLVMVQPSLVSFA